MYAFARVLLVALTVSLAGAGSATGAPTLVVESGPKLAARAPVKIDVSSPEGIGELKLLVPSGYGVDLSRPPGEQLGTAFGVARTAGAEIEVSGTLSVSDSSAAPGCSGGSHGSVWALSLHGSGATLDALLAVDATVAGAPESLGKSHEVTLCTPIPSGVELVRLKLSLDDAVTTPAQAGRYAWRALVAPTGGGPFSESRSISPLPVELIFSGTYSRNRGAARLKGKLIAAGEPVAGAPISIAAGRSVSALRPALRATTGPKGGFEATKAIGRATVFQASSQRLVAVGSGETVVVAPATSQALQVRIPPPPVLRLGSRGPAVRQLQRRLAELRYLPSGSADGNFGARTWHAVVAFQGWTGLARTGVVDRRTWTRLGQTAVPRPWGGLRYGLEIDIPRQVLLLVRGGVTVRAIHVSTGAGGRTPTGRFSIRAKALMSWSVPFQVWMPYAQYFYGGYALHSYPLVPAYPASHGCVRLPSMEAPVVYSFTTIGTPVWIR